MVTLMVDIQNKPLKNNTSIRFGTLICEKEGPQDRLSAGLCESCDECNTNMRIKFRNKAKRRWETNVMR